MLVCKKCSKPYFHITNCEDLCSKCYEKKKEKIKQKLKNKRKEIINKGEIKMNKCKKEKENIYKTTCKDCEYNDNCENVTKKGEI